MNCDALEVIKCPVHNGTFRMRPDRLQCPFTICAHQCCPGEKQDRACWPKAEGGMGALHLCVHRDSDLRPLPSPFPFSSPARLLLKKRACR